MRERDNRRRGKKQEKDYDHSLLHVARVARVVQGGRRFSFRATIAIGDRKGKVGVGVAKGVDVSTAIGKAIHDAKKNLVSFPIFRDTIPHEISAKFESAKIILKPAKEGKGIVAGGAIRVLADLGGLKNLTAKSLGSSNKINTARAMLCALKQLKVREAKSPEVAVAIPNKVEEAEAKVQKDKLEVNSTESKTASQKESK